MELKTIDKLRIISDTCLNRNNLVNRIEHSEKIIHSIQRQLNIPENYEVAVAVLAVLFNISRINGRVPFQRFKLKMGLNEITDIQEDFIYLLNNQYIELGKYANNVEWIRIKAKFYSQIWNDMTEENHKLFMLLTGRELNDLQLKYFKNHLFNDGLDVAELFLTAVVFRQFEAAKAIISFGFDINKELETMANELFICSQMSGSKFCIDFYVQNGLKITDTLLKEIMKYAEDSQNDFYYDRAVELIEELKQKMNEK